MDRLMLYHGSSSVIERPSYGMGNANNDYGLAFYCTRIPEMAYEWAVTEQSDGYSNIYEVDLQGLRVLDLMNGQYHLLNWLSILLENRVFRTNGISSEARQYILDEFAVEYRDYDIIKGYRADDSYFSFANAFLNNSLPLERLGEVMHLGELGEQYAIKSERAFEQIEFIGFNMVDRFEYFPKKKKRDEAARIEFAANYRNFRQGTFMIDIIREEWRDDDVRLQHYICK